jgi:hypothetical protein
MALVTGNEDRQWLYPAMTRGTDANLAYVFTTPPRPADPRPRTRPAPGLDRHDRLQHQRDGHPPAPREPETQLPDQRRKRCWPAPARHCRAQPAPHDDAITATPVKAEFPEADQVCWETYECRPSGSCLIRMAPRSDDGSLSVHVSAMYYWQDAAQAHRALEQDDIPGEVVLIVGDDLAATLEV